MNILQVAQRITEEENRITKYLHPSTSGILKQALDQIFITDRLEYYYIESRKLIEDENIDGIYFAKTYILMFAQFENFSRFVHSVQTGESIGRPIKECS